MNQKRLNEILKEHEKWVETWGKEGVRANLIRANLIRADLRGSNLKEADLILTNLSRANLIRADLRGANLSGADLRGADLSEADLSEANLIMANLSGADLSEANLIGADLSGADLREAKNVPEYLQDMLRVCPKERKFIGWKNCGGGTIIKLEIPEDAKRSNATTRKCRCSKAKVLSIENLNGDILEIKEYDHCAYGHITVYKVGEMVYPDCFDEDWKNECSHGIHFFMTRKEAVKYFM